jgi:hypothetical protein
VQHGSVSDLTTPPFWRLTLREPSRIKVLLIEALLRFSEDFEDLIEGRDLLGEEHRLHGGIVSAEFRNAVLGREKFEGAGDGCVVASPGGLEVARLVDSDSIEEVKAVEGFFPGGVKP